MTMTEKNAYNNYKIPEVFLHRDELAATEERLKHQDMVLVVGKDGETKEIKRDEFLPDEGYLLHFNIATANNDPHLEPLPRAHDTIAVDKLCMVEGEKQYVLEAEAALVGVFENGEYKPQFIGTVLDLGDRTPRLDGTGRTHKTWTKGVKNGGSTGMSTTWMEVDGWDDIQGTELKYDVYGPEGELLLSAPNAQANSLKLWGERLGKWLANYPKEKLAEIGIEEGKPFLLSTGQIKFEDDGARSINPEEIHSFNARAVMNLGGGRIIETVMPAETQPSNEENFSPHLASKEAYAQAHPADRETIPEKMIWTDQNMREGLEAQLREMGLIGIIESDGSISVRPIREFVSEHIFTMKWNSHVSAEKGIAPDYSLVPNAKDRLSLKSAEIMRGRKYAIEGEVAFMFTVTEHGVEVSHVGMYQDITDRSVSPANKTWGKSKVAGMGPLWLTIDDWDDVADADVFAQIEGFKIISEGDDGEPVHQTVGFPSNSEEQARFWGKDLERVLVNHPVFKDLELKPGETIMATAGLLYKREVSYGDRFVFADEVDTVKMGASLTLKDGRTVTSEMVATSVDIPPREPTIFQEAAVDKWKEALSVDQLPVRVSEGSPRLKEEYTRVQETNAAEEKLDKILTAEAFTVSSSPNVEDIEEALPSLSEMHRRYQELVANWPDGAGIDLLAVRNTDTVSEIKGELPGTIVGKDGSVISSPLTKRGAQKSYDVAAELWDEPDPDLVISSGLSSSLSTLEIALQAVGENFPVSMIQRDWRLNERYFADSVGKEETKFSPVDLFHFNRSVPEGENFTLVYIRTMSFMLDLLETAANFYNENKRKMRVVVGNHEGTMQMLKLLLNGGELENDDKIFERIDGAKTFRFDIDKPFSIPPSILEKFSG
jgi:broad specificity phosphatase PhoE